MSENKTLDEVLDMFGYTREQLEQFYEDEVDEPIVEELIGHLEHAHIKMGKLDDATTGAVARLDAIDGGEPEGNHNEADRILLDLVAPEVKAAYERLVDRAIYWATS